MAGTNSHPSLPTRRIGHQLVFRVESGRKPQGPRGVDDPSTDQRVVHTHRAHCKTRTGCGNCKKRKVKCDEGKPGCRRCQRYGIPCDYSTPQRRSPNSRSPPLSIENGGGGSTETFNRSAYSMAMTDLAGRIDQALRLDPATEQETPSAKSMRVAAVHHYINFAATDTSMSEAHNEVLAGDMIRTAFSSPCLLHAVLGVAGTHLRHLLPDKSYKVIEAYHWQHAIRLYRQQLSKPITPQTMDPLTSTCILLSVHLFFTEGCTPEDSWVFSSDPTALNWLTLQCGLRHILYHTKEWRDQTIWRKVFHESDDEHRTFNDKRPGREGLHQGLAELCEVDETTTRENSPYLWPLRMLTPMLSVKPSRHSLSKVVTFMGRLLPDFIDLLFQKEPKAMLILGYWLGRMCEERQWWVYSRVRTECMAICRYLEDSDDPRILKLLEYPAKKCGYLLNHHVQRELDLEANVDAVGSAETVAVEY